MTETTTRELQDAIRELHGCESRFVESVPVSSRFRVGTANGPDIGTLLVWTGTVSVFDLVGHPRARRCYAWCVPMPGSDTVRKYYAFLHVGAVDSPEAAIRALHPDDPRGRPTV